MVRKVYLTVAALIFGFECWLAIRIGAISIYQTMIGLDWVQILFYMFLGFVVIAAFALTNSWIVLGEKSPILYWWLKVNQFISKMTWELANKIVLGTILGLLIIILAVGCTVGYGKFKSAADDLQKVEYYKQKCIEQQKTIEDQNKLINDMSIDYADLHNTVKKRLAMGGRGNF
jgi:hypothetical protein